jgi:hypothetical protein
LAETEKRNINYKDLVVSTAGVATATFALYNAYENVVDMGFQVSKDNLAVKTAQDAAEGSQTKYNATVAKYGEYSVQAKATANDLSIAQERHCLDSPNTSGS